MLYPFAITGGSRAIAITSSGNIAHKTNHNMELSPLGLAIKAPTVPAITIRMI